MSTQAELPPEIKEPGTYGITDSWAVTKRLKTAESLIKAVKDRLTENKAYEGDNKGYRNYFRTTLSMIVAAESRRGPSPLRGPGDNKLCKGLQGSSGPLEPTDGEGVRVPG